MFRFFLVFVWLFFVFWWKHKLIIIWSKLMFSSWQPRGHYIFVWYFGLAIHITQICCHLHLFLSSQFYWPIIQFNKNCIKQSLKHTQHTTFSILNWTFFLFIYFLLFCLWFFVLILTHIKFLISIGQFSNFTQKKVTLIQVN